MLNPSKLAFALFAGSLVSACAASGSRPLPQDRFERAVSHAPGAAQPGRIVARELEFARAAKEEGQWTAFRRFAATGAVIHAPSGALDAGAWLADRADPVEAVKWAPRAVWMSCDGQTAVSNGRFRDPEGMVGSFVTVWQRQENGEYLWVYDAAIRDDPQPPAKPALPDQTDDDEIVVSAISSIKGLVADCARRGETQAKAPILNAAEGTLVKSNTSRDGTLRWRWEHTPGASRRFVAEFLTGGYWRVAINQNLGGAVKAGSVIQ